MVRRERRLACHFPFFIFHPASTGENSLWLLLEVLSPGRGGSMGCSNSVGFAPAGDHTEGTRTKW